MNQTETLPKSGNKVTAAWVSALERTAPIARQPGRILPQVIAERAAELGDAPALLSDGECFSYRELDQRIHQYARWALAQEITRGQCVGLLMPNRPEYLAAWLGISAVGGVVALLNTSLVGSSLVHCINLAAPGHIIVDAELSEQFATALPLLASSPTVWLHGGAAHERRIDVEVDRQSPEPLAECERRQVTIEDCALYIYTSGTTGLPNAARITHGRVMQWSHWFAGLMDVQPADRLYSCLPMYHSVGGIVAPCATLAGGGSVAIASRFSASQFWDDIARWRCTLFQYIGELCRYLLNAPPSPNEASHNLRMVCGNGLCQEVWEPFQRRFAIPRIFEFYAATEGAVSLFNVEGEAGSIGRTPPYLAARFPARIIRYDAETDAPVRDAQGLCIPCVADEAGELIGPLLQGPEHVGNRFEGYVDERSSARKVLRDVFRPGDAWFRTGDLVRKDARGFYYFVDRVGETFRWKGENVSCAQVASSIAALDAVREAVVYGVRVPGADGRAGMAAIVAEGKLDLQALRAHLLERMPAHACPVFLRVRSEIEVTGTFKYNKVSLARQGFDPAETDDPIFFFHPEFQEYIGLDRVLYQRIQSGQVRI